MEIEWGGGYDLSAEELEKLVPEFKSGAIFGAGEYETKMKADGSAVLIYRKSKELQES